MRAILAMILVVASLACRATEEQDTETTPVPESLTATQDEATEYTLRILFSGLVALVPTDETSNPAGFWALVGNVTNPAGLPVTASRGIHPHIGQIYVPEASLSMPNEEFKVASREPCLVQRGFNLSGQSQWRVLPLKSEDVSLAGDADIIQDRLSISRGPLSNEVVPAVFDFAADIQGLLVDILPEPAARELREELITESYSGDLVSARFFFDRGSVSTARLWRQLGNPARIARFVFDHTQPGQSRAIAEAVGIELKVRGPVRFQRHLRSTSKKTQLPDFVVAGSAGALVTVIVENEPSVCNDVDEDHPSPDFLFNYNFVNGPFPADATQDDLPLPAAVEGQDGGHDNGGCSPPRFSAPN